MTMTITQEIVSLRHGDNLVMFYWPLATNVVHISATETPEKDGDYSVEEAHELFETLLNMGAY